VQRQGADQDDIIHAGGGGHVEHRLDDPLAVVRLFHGRQWQRDVVEGDREAHAGFQQRRQRRRVTGRVQQGEADGLVGVRQRLHRLGRVEDAAAHWEAKQPESFAMPGEGGRGGTIDLEDEPGTRHQACVSLERNFRVFRRSKATLVAPRRPASAACWIASRYRSRG